MTQQIDYSLHTHTLGFDGRNTVKDMVESARSKDIKTFGISNHFILHKNIKNSPMYKFAKLGSYEKIYNDNRDELVERFQHVFQDIRGVREKYPDMNILCGMEMDLFKDEQWVDDVNYAVRILKPDYVIGARHFVEATDGTLLNVHDVKGADSVTAGRLLRSYYQFYDDDFVDLIKRNLKFDINFFAHIDLPRKVGVYNPMMEKYAVERLAKIGIPLELNTSLITKEKYLAGGAEPVAIKTMAETNVPVLFSDDAHDVAGIKKGTEAVFDMVQNLGIKNICKKSADLECFINLKSR